jgi:transcriptional regulator with XRE-family HTH domain
MPAELDTKTLEDLGPRIRRLRAERGIGQERLAIEAHVDQSGLSKFERGKDRRMSRQALERIAVVLALSYEQLIEGTDFQG